MHRSDCASNSRDNPDLYGPCDCGMGRDAPFVMLNRNILEQLWNLLPEEARDPRNADCIGEALCRVLNEPPPLPVHPLELIGPPIEISGEDLHKVINGLEGILQPPAEGEPDDRLRDVHDACAMLGVLKGESIHYRREAERAATLANRFQLYSGRLVQLLLAQVGEQRGL